MISLPDATSNPWAMMVMDGDAAIANAAVVHSWRFYDVTSLALFALNFIFVGLDRPLGNVKRLCRLNVSVQLVWIRLFTVLFFNFRRRLDLFYLDLMSTFVHDLVFLSHGLLLILNQLLLVDLESAPILLLLSHLPVRRWNTFH